MAALSWERRGEKVVAWRVVVHVGDEFPVVGEEIFLVEKVDLQKQRQVAEAAGGRIEVTLLSGLSSDSSLLGFQCVTFWSVYSEGEL